MKHYDVEINGTRTTLLLSDADARARGLEGKERKAPANKARRAANKSKPANPADSAPGAGDNPGGDVVAGAGADRSGPQDS